MGEKVVSGSTTTSKALRGVHPRGRGRAPAAARPRARGVAVQLSHAVRARGSNARTTRAGGKSNKTQAQIHEERMKNLRKAQRVRRKNIKEGRKMGANKGKRS